MWQEIITHIQNNNNFVISSHQNPDCDALGSELALAEFLKTLGKKVTIINSDSAPQPFRFLDPKRRLKRYAATKHAAIIEAADIIVVLDASGGWDRLGQVGKALAKARAVKVCIDHHPESGEFVDTAVIDVNAAATGELIFDLIQTMGGTITPSMAQALYTAILTDTGSFRFPKTSPRTHQIAAELLAAGANPLHIFGQLYEQNSVGLVRLKGHVMESIQTALNDQIAYYKLSKKTLRDYGVKAAELDGFASLGQQIGPVRVTVFCTEATKGRIKLSLRSDGTVAINEIAQGYGGGGHASAAGALIGEGQLDSIMMDVVEQVKTLLR